ncbi:MAG: hypothetical protein SWK90_18605, partial [Chloroflexota bacterium]|nr:hypothetical protein [Chloroflexota bacterium]
TATISDPEDNTPSNGTSSKTIGEHTVYLPLVIRCFPLQPSVQHQGPITGVSVPISPAQDGVNGAMSRA